MSGSGDCFTEYNSAVFCTALNSFAGCLTRGIFCCFPRAARRVSVVQFCNGFCFNNLVTDSAVQLACTGSVFCCCFGCNPLPFGMASLGNNALFYSFSAALALADTLAFFLAGGFLYDFPITGIMRMNRGRILRPTVHYDSIAGRNILIYGLSGVMGEVDAAMGTVAPCFRTSKIPTAPGGIMQSDTAVKRHPVIHIRVIHQVCRGRLIRYTVCAGRRIGPVEYIACNAGRRHDRYTVNIQGNDLIG